MIKRGAEEEDLPARASSKLLATIWPPYQKPRANIRKIVPIRRPMPARQSQVVERNKSRTRRQKKETDRETERKKAETEKETDRNEEKKKVWPGTLYVQLHRRKETAERNEKDRDADSSRSRKREEEELDGAHPQNYSGLPAYPSRYACVSIYPSINRSICLSVYQSVYVSF